MRVRTVSDEQGMWKGLKIVHCVKWGLKVMKICRFK